MSGSTISLSPDSQVAIRTNLDYYMTVNVTDLSSSSGNSISRSNIEVMNGHANASGNSDIASWSAFSGNSPLWVWGISGGPSYMPPLANGTYTAGYEYGYDSSTYTPVSWRVNVPVATPEDHFTATITYEISYP